MAEIAAEPPTQIEYPTDHTDTTPLADVSKEDIALIVGHCDIPAITNFPSRLRAIAQQGDLDAYPPEPKPGDPLPFEYAEHRWLGDALELQGHSDANNSNKSAAVNPFTLKNGLKVTYGQINGLAGDFFAANDPISDPDADDATLRKRFQAAFNELALGQDSKTMAEEILKVVKLEVDTIDDALKNYKSAYEAYEEYEKQHDPTFTLDKISAKAKATGMTYVELAKKNIDHFGLFARKAYNAGHAWALDVASKGDHDSLLEAYTINAFADHFLEDSFSSGHFRVPRKHLVDNILTNAAAKLMHDEDSRLGLTISSPSGDLSWTAYGDKHLFDDAAKTNKAQCFAALQKSAAEVFEANSDRKTIPQKDFGAWTFAPSEHSLLSRSNNPAPLMRIVNGEVHRRKDLSKTVAQTDREDLVKKWDEYVPVVGSLDIPTALKWFVPDSAIYWLSWGKFVYAVAPDGSVKQLVKSKLKSLGVPGVVLDWLLG